MDSGERPSKIRKLSHGSAEQPQPAPTASKEPAPPDTVSNGNISKPRDLASAIPQSSSQQAHTDEINTSNTLDTPLSTQPAAPLSKNQQKKLRRQQEWEAAKPERKAKRKEKAKAARERKRTQRLANANDNPPSTHVPRTRSVRLPITILIDCDFDDKMADKERISLGSQITRAYSDNSRAPYSAHLMVCSWGGKLRDRFDTTLHGQYRNWKDVVIVEEAFVEAAEQAGREMRGKNGGRLAGIFEPYATLGKKARRKVNGIEQQDNTAKDSDAAETQTVPPPANDEVEVEPEVEAEPEVETNQPSPAPQSQSIPTPLSLPPSETIYLTSDSPHTLTTLSPYSTYIVGGLVDKNRHKGICYQRAHERGIKTAKLPIGEFMEMQSRFVLATNHVVEIMVRYLECGDWGEAFLSVIPKRKGGRLKDGEKDVGGGEGKGVDGDGSEEAEEEERSEDEDGDGDDDVMIETEEKDSDPMEAAS